jgi:ABC-type multidrug transport system permease subunit
MDLKDIFFKIISILFAIFYYLYALVIAKQVKTMDKALQDKYNWLILLITSLQVTVSLILLIILILSIFII